MKVKDLLVTLSKIDPNLDVVCYTEDDALLAGGHMFRLLDIENVSVSDAEKLRDSSGTPTLRLGKSESSSPIAFINVISDF